MMKQQALEKLPALLIALVCGGLAFFFAVQNSFVNPYPFVCNFVAEKIYLPDPDVIAWKKQCLQRSHLVTPYSPKKNILRDMNNVFSLLKVSHLEIFDPSEVKDLWNGEAKETGIESEFIESELVIFKVHGHSPAEAAGLRRGDIVVSLDGEQPSPWTARGNSGVYKIRRGTQEFIATLEVSTFRRDERIQIRPLGKNNVMIEVPSFRAEFFSTERMTEVAKAMQGKSMVLLDLRGNLGGNFVGGLRFLSLFLCDSTEIGMLKRTRGAQGVADLPDNLTEENQVDVINNHQLIHLKTYSNSACYNGKVKVLVDGETSSVAEMVAQGMKEFRKSPLLGTPSKGQLLVGVWYPLDQEMGPGIQISIPEAFYVSAKGRDIEGQGVELDRILYYELPEMQAGVDSWVKSALD